MRQSYNTQEMIWNFAEVLEYLSQDFTFVPGDVIAGGTSGGHGRRQIAPRPDGKRPLDLFLKVGDTVEVSSSKIGALRTRSSLASESKCNSTRPCAQFIKGLSFRMSFRAKLTEKSFLNLAITPEYKTSRP